MVCDVRQELKLDIRMATSRDPGVPGGSYPSMQCDSNKLTHDQTFTTFSVNHGPLKTDVLYINSAIRIIALL